MIEINRILCPVDFSEYSRHALQCAVAMARWYKSRVTALHVAPRWPPAGEFPPLRMEGVQPVPELSLDRDELLRQVQSFVEPERPRDVTVDLMLQDAYDAHREILAQAQALRADLVVIGSHGRSGFERLLLGSTSEKVLRKATCPVMVVPPRARDAAAHAVHIKSILCPVDFSTGSSAALRYAISLAEEADARLTLLHAIEIPPELYPSPEPRVVNVDAMRAEAEADSLTRLRELVPEAARTYCTVETIVAEGRASREILELAADRKSDVIVMGVQGRGAVDLLMFGSNTHEVIRGARCPVLTIRES